MDPMVITVKVGESFSIPLTLTVGSPVNAAAVFGVFDGNTLRCDGVTAGSALPDTIVMRADNTRGRFDCMATYLGGEVDGATAFDLALVQFTSLVPNIGSQVQYTFMSPRLTQAAYKGDPLPIEQVNISVVVEAQPLPPVPADIVGVSVLAGAYGSVEGDANFVKAADLNGDGAVDAVDFGILKDQIIVELDKPDLLAANVRRRS